MCKTTVGHLHIEESMEKCPKAQPFGSFYMTNRHLINQRILQTDFYTKAHICSGDFVFTDYKYSIILYYIHDLIIHSMIIQ